MTNVNAATATAIEDFNGTFQDDFHGATKTASTVIELKAKVVTGEAAIEAQASKALASETLTVYCLGNAMTHEQIEAKALATVSAIADHTKQGVQHFVELGNLFAASETYFTLIGGSIKSRTEKAYLIKEGKKVVDVLPLEDGKLASEGSYIQYLNTTALKEYAITQKRIRSDCKFVSANIGRFNKLELSGNIAKLGLQDIVKLIKDSLKPQGPEITDVIELTIGESESDTSESDTSESDTSESDTSETPPAPELIPAPPTDAAGFAAWVDAYTVSNKIEQDFFQHFFYKNVGTILELIAKLPKTKK